MLRNLLLPILLLAVSASALERQPNADYRARRVALSRKASGGVVVLFAGVEAEGPNALYGFRQDNNFYYLTGLDQTGAALLAFSSSPLRLPPSGRNFVGASTQVKSYRPKTNGVWRVRNPSSVIMVTARLLGLG